MKGLLTYPKRVRRVLFVRRGDAVDGIGEREREREKKGGRGREGGKVRGPYDVHLLAFHGRLTRKWKVLEEVPGRNNQDEYAFPPSKIFSTR